MIYAVLFEDDPERVAMRREHMPAHLDFLQRNAGAIKGAGPLSEGEAGTPAGGLWLVQAGSPAEVTSLIEADPFWPTGLRKSVRVLQWTQVFAEGERKI